MFTVFYSNSRNCEDHRTEIEEKDAQEEEHREEHKGVDKNYLFTVILMDTHIDHIIHQLVNVGGYQKHSESLVHCTVGQCLIF